MLPGPHVMVPRVLVFVKLYPLVPTGRVGSGSGDLLLYAPIQSEWMDEHACHEERIPK